MKQKFSELEKLLRQTAQARQDLKAVVAKLNAQRKDYSAEYAKLHIDPKIMEAQADLKALHQARFDQVCAILQDLSKSATEKQAKLDLASPALSNALKVIELSGSSLDGDTVRKINASFKGDQSALRMLRDVYKAAGVQYDGGLNDQIYEPESAF
jgi:hypothetical protein